MNANWLGSLRWYIICLQVPFRILLARLVGVIVGKRVKLVGRVRLKRARGARIEIGDAVCIYSQPAANELIGRPHSTLWAMAPGALIKLGRNVGCSSVCICAAAGIHIGEGTIIGADAMILDNDFHLPLPGWEWRNASTETAKPIHIGRGCFIGTRAIILKGVRIGDGAVIGAGAVVTRNVPSGFMASGNPAVVKPLAVHWKHCTKNLGAPINFL
jgi:acetyltransferase-like isoleucine patch superfamily enzyme